MFTDCKPVYSQFNQPYILRRLDRNGGEDRYYYKQIDEKRSQPFLSVTSWVQKCLGFSSQMLSYYGDRRTDLAKMTANYAADYGTAMHICSSMVAQREIVSFEDIHDFAVQQAIASGWGHLALAEWPSRMKNDMACLLSFFTKRNVKILAIEIVLASEEHGIAGAIDFVIEMDWYRGRSNAILDLKSGKNFYDSHALQLQGYKAIWNENFPEHKIDLMFNWKPEDAYAKSKYTLKNQSSNFANSANQYLALTHLNGWVKAPSSTKELVGAFDFQSFNIENHIEHIAI